jgi:hypothetical protein
MRILFFVLLILGISSNSWAEQNNSSLAEKKAAPFISAPVISVDSKVKKKQSVTFESLAQLDELIKLGVPALALSLLEDEQKNRQPFTVDWYAFEYKRMALFSVLERWNNVIERTKWLFDTAKPEIHITQKIRYWFETQQVMAKLQLKQSEHALLQLQSLIWRSKAENRDESLLAVWRRLVIRAYLQLQRDNDARRALIKYDQDYKTDLTDIDWMMLQAQVLLRTHRPQQAILLLKPIAADNAVDVEALLLIAQLQHQPDKAPIIKQKIREKIEGKVLTRPARWAYSYVDYQIAKVLSDPQAQIVNLELMLSLDIKYPVFNEHYQVSADDLWALYRTKGLAIANQHGLLFGNDEQWHELSDKLIISEPEKALALNAALVLQTNTMQLTLSQQHQTIVELLEKRNNGLELINQLYLHSVKVTNVRVLPAEVRFRLVDYALSEGDYFEAATIMKSLDEPPPGKTLFDWRMRKARVLILQGEYKQSETLIRQTFSEKSTITRAELDRYIQVVFDFQTVQQHQQALRLFDLLDINSLDDKLKREINFWKAESHFSLEKYDRAAMYYLESARAIAGANNDLWAQSARFKAAQSLVLAEIYGDAEKVFSALLRITASDSRKALINQNLQKIRLLKTVSSGTGMYR